MNNDEMPLIPPICNCCNRDQPLTSNPDVRKLAERMYRNYLVTSRGPTTVFANLPEPTKDGWDAVACNVMHGVYKHTESA